MTPDSSRYPFQIKDICTIGAAENGRPIHTPMTPVRGIMPPDIDGVFPKIVHFLEGGAEYGAGRWTMAELQESLKEGRRQLWVDDGLKWALITQIDNYPAIKVLNIFWAGGEMPADHNDILDAIEAWGVRKGCTQSEVGGRKGWARTLRGYRPAPWHVLIKDIA